MKEKILAAIKAKFPAAKLSTKRLDAIAATIELKAGTDETLIEATLDTFNEFYPLTDLAKEDQIRSTLEGKLKATQKTETPPASEQPVIDNDTPEWAKALIKSNEILSTKLLAIEGKEQQGTIKSKLSNALKDVPATFWEKRSLPDNDEGIDSFVADVTKDFGSFTQDLTNKGLAITPAPGSGGDSKSTVISPDIKAYVEKQSALQVAKA